LEIPPLVHLTVFEFHCGTTFYMSREQKITSACTYPNDLIFMWTYKLPTTGLHAGWKNAKFTHNGF